MNALTVNTRLVALLGNPLGHSISAQMHNRVYQEMGMDYCYLPFEVAEEDLAVVFAGMKKINFVGCNVTIPHKRAIVDLLDEIDPLAAVIGAVNTVCLTDGRSRGFNTDGAGFLRSLREEAGIVPAGKRFLVFGCGGAARAIAITLANEKAERIILCNRTYQKAVALAEEINQKIAPCASAIKMEQEGQQDHAADADVLINTTSVGMSSCHRALPCPEACIMAHHTVVDIVYNPYTTLFLQKAREKGATVVHGLGMLIYQGAAAFRLFTGREPLVEVMQREAFQLLR